MGHHGHDHDHPHDRAGSLRRLAGRLAHLLRPHGHDPADAVDVELETSRRGIRTLVLSAAGLFGTAGLQAVVLALTGSVALLSDTLHNLADALTVVPLAVAFRLVRRPPNRRYTYGYGRAEDLAGVAVVALIAASAVLAALESALRLLHPRPLTHLPLVAVAGVVGFVGNEAVARYRIQVGRQIGSAALVADGLHARTDGLTSLAVLLGVIGVALGVPRADPAVGLLITVAILVVLWQAGRQVLGRLMDAVDPAMVDSAEEVLRNTPGVLDVGEVRLRWIGHALRAECEVAVDAHSSLVDAHQIAEEAQHRLLHEVRRLAAAFVHADPYSPDDHDRHHALSRHHGVGRRD